MIFMSGRSWRDPAATSQAAIPGIEIISGRQD
jgi:hypothetical protein